MIGAIAEHRKIESVEQLLALQNEDFVRCAYQTILGRPPDPKGFAGYLNQVRRGADKKKIIYVLATSPEGRNRNTLQLSGLKEMIEVFRSAHSSFLSKVLSGLFANALRPILERFDEAENRLDKLNDLLTRRLSDLDAAETHRNVETNGTVLHSAQGIEPTKPIVTAQLREDATGTIGSPPIYAVRSRLNRRRQNLERAFGRETVTDRFFQTIFFSMRLVADSRTVVGFLIEDQIIARWLLTGPSPASSFGILSTQLKALYYSCFDCSLTRRSGAEMATCNSAALRALSAPIWPTSFTNVPITAFMLCAIDKRHGKSFDFQNANKRDGICADYFLRLVPHYGLQRYVTLDQRRALAQPADGSWEGRVSLLQSWVLDSDEDLRRKFAPLDTPALAAFVNWFNDIGVWDRGLDYCLSEEKLSEGQMRITRTKEGHDLVIPAYFGAKNLLPEDLGFDDTEDWLHALVQRRRNDTNLPSRIFSSSVLAYIANGSVRKQHVPKQTTDVAYRLGTRSVRPGCMLTFSTLGNGIRHLIGRGWSQPEDTHVWTAAHMAFLSIDLDSSVVDSLDLFVEFNVGQQPQARVTISWNGRIVETIFLESDIVTTVTCSLGKDYKTGGACNLLCFGIDQLFKPSDRGGNDNRTLGLALHRLSLLHR